MAAPEGNINWKGKVWNDALRKAIVQDDGLRVRKAAEKLLDKAADGEAGAVKEIADRLDGKAAQDVKLEADINIHTLAEVLSAIE